MCIGCDLENGESTKIIDNPATDFVVRLKNVEGAYWLIMLNGRHSTMKSAYYCPFCGRKLSAV